MNTAILASHGTDSEPGAAAIAALVVSVAASLPEWQVAEAFIDVQQPDVPTVLATFSSETVTVAPLLLATGYHVRKDLAEAATEAQSGGTEVRIVPALGPDERLAELLVQRLAEAGANLESNTTDIIVLAVAGSSDPAAQQQSLLVQAMLEQKLGLEVQLAYLSAAEPRLKDLVPKLKFQNPRRRVVLATYLLADGYFVGLTQRSGAHIVARPLLAPELPVPKQLVDVVIARLNGPELGCLKSAGAGWSCPAGCAKPCG